MPGEIKDECGIFAYYSLDKAVGPQIKRGISALQDRGDQNAGGMTIYRGEFKQHKGPGRVDQVFSGLNGENLSDVEIERLLPGNMGIGHNRWSTQPGGRSQPVYFPGDRVALAHNGNVYDTQPLDRSLEARGKSLIGTNDSERIQQVFNDWLEIGAPIGEALSKTYAPIRTRGASSIVFMTRTQIGAFRDTPGIRPLVIGETDNGFIFASETHALDKVQAKFVREVRPGELVIADHNGLESITIEPYVEEKMDVFELIYFANNNSLVKGRTVRDYRKAMGRMLALGDSVGADLVIGVPNSGLSGGRGYAEQSGIEFSDEALVKKLDQRSFTQDTQEERIIVANKKYEARKDLIQGKRLVVVDDSIVRGVTTPPVISLLREAGAKEIHFRVCALPIRFPDYFGNAFSTSKELIAANHTEEEIRQIIGADSLKFNTRDAFEKSLGGARRFFTYHYFDGNYPHPVPQEQRQRELIAV